MIVVKPGIVDPELGCVPSKALRHSANAQTCVRLGTDGTKVDANGEKVAELDLEFAGAGEYPEALQKLLRCPSALSRARSSLAYLPDMSRDSLRGFAHLGMLITLLQCFPKHLRANGKRFSI